MVCNIKPSVVIGCKLIVNENHRVPVRPVLSHLWYRLQYDQSSHAEYSHQNIASVNIIVGEHYGRVNNSYEA